MRSQKLLGAAALMLVTALSACTIDRPAAEDPAVATDTAVKSTGADAPQPTRATSAPGPDPTRAEQNHTPAPGQHQAALTEIISELEQRTGAQVRVALARPAETVTAGTLPTGQPAWSTIKVPLAVAALRQDASHAAAVSQAITVSDNAAAQALWDGLGGGVPAAAEVEAVLREGGDPTTRVQPAVTRPEYTAFGQSSWPETAQAEFARQLPTLAGAEQVLAEMANIAAGQDYGLGIIPGARFKGGWGPDETGVYLVRQFGLVGETGIALAVVPADGSYESGQAVLTELAQLLAPQLS